MKKTLAVILLFLAAVLVFCGCDGKDETQNTTDTGDINEVEHFDTKEDDYPFVIWSEGDVKVCAKNEDAYKGADNKKIKLTIGNESVVFNASFSFRIGTYTKYYNLDVTGDGTRDHLLILPVNHGTGVYTDCLYVFNGKTLKEIPYENSLEYLSPIVSLTGDDNNYYVSFAANSQTYPRTLFQSYGTEFEVEAPILNCGFSKFRIEEVGDGKGLIFIDHGVAIGGGNVEFLGECSVFFSYSGNRFDCEYYSFVPYGISEVNKKNWCMRSYNNTIFLTNGEKRYTFTNKIFNNALISHDDKKPYAYISNDERYVVIVYYVTDSPLKHATLIPLAQGSAEDSFSPDINEINDPAFVNILSHHGIKKDTFSTYFQEDSIEHTIEIEERENNKFVLHSTINTDDDLIKLCGEYTFDYTKLPSDKYVAKSTTVKDADQEPEILEELKSMADVPSELAKTATAFITKDIKTLEHLLGTREGVLRQYRDFEFGSYSFKFKDRTLEMAVEITRSSLPDVQPGSYTIKFSEGRYAPVAIDGIGYSRNDLWEGFETEADRYVHNWILCTGLWDFSSVDEINASKDSLYKTGLIMYLKVYEDIDTVEEYEEAANAFFGIDDLHIPDNLIEEDGTVIDNWGWGGPVRTYKKVGGSVDLDTGMLTVRVLTYADFAGTVRSHIYEYKFEDCGDYLKVIYSGIYEKSQYEPEDRYVG